MKHEMQLALALEAAHHAGTIIKEFYDLLGNITVEEKPGEGPVTEADLAVNGYLCNIFHQAYPGYGILTEEQLEFEGEGDPIVETSLRKAVKEWKHRERVWVFDPLDGTKEFLRRNGEFGVQIALLEGDEVQLGVHHYPILGETYFASRGAGAFKQTQYTTEGIHVSDVTDFEAMHALVSRSTTNALDHIYTGLNLRKITPMGSGGLKMCRIAEGAADLYFTGWPTLGPWDTCSSEIILGEAGGSLTYTDGSRISYRDEVTKLPKPTLASNGRRTADLVKLLKSYNI